MWGRWVVRPYALRPHVPTAIGFITCVPTTSLQGGEFYPAPGPEDKGESGVGKATEAPLPLRLAGLRKPALLTLQWTVDCGQ